MGGAWHGAGRELFLGLGPNNRNNGNNGVWLAVVVLVVSNRLLFKLGSLVWGRCLPSARWAWSRLAFLLTRHGKAPVPRWWA